MKIVLDTNCLLMIVSKKSQYRKVFDLICSGEIRLAISNEILTEYEEQLSLFYSENFAQNVSRYLLSLLSIEFVQVYYNWHFITKDEDDNKFVDCAVSANADLIVTNDKHFKELDKIEFPKVKHVTIQKFFDSL